MTYVYYSLLFTLMYRYTFISWKVALKGFYMKREITYVVYPRINPFFRDFYIFLVFSLFPFVLSALR